MLRRRPQFVAVGMLEAFDVSTSAMASEANTSIAVRSIASPRGPGTGRVARGTEQGASGVNFQAGQRPPVAIWATSPSSTGCGR